ncbi:PAS domain-containing protein [Chitinophaga sp. SYP-B3965]|uniref:sensor histidine kinase n=1 Tax=Chitinophaga sp. SYP-B3965 TaxID=2663120 RepID=UPI0012997E81|nr:ATP-binding protein [Chitinophaga sp. SYP-B3965]MRG44633.1 PAS domain-containing protein [Chitinophaga sp. SYP-B3965]
MEEQLTKSIESLEAELEELRHQLYEAQETIDAIRTGQIDAIVVNGSNGHELYTLKTADHSYRVFIEKMTEGVVSLNHEGIILYCNSQFASLLNMPISRVIGTPFQDFVPEENKRSIRRLFEESWSKDCKEEVTLHTCDLEIPVLLSLTALEFNENMALNIIVTDLTIQKRTQQQLETTNAQLAEMNHELELSNHDLQQFASVASHDLQEPLRKIQMFSNLLKNQNKEILSEESQRFLDKIMNSSKRMKTLILDVLSYSRLSANNNVFEPVNLNDITKELLDDFELIIQEKKAEIRVGDLPVIEANRGQIRQVFQNMVSNALKFSKPDLAPVIEISSTYLVEKFFDGLPQPDGPYCLIRIKDNGIGFDQKYQNHIFALFERLHSKDSYEGSGIGLSITKKIIEKHDGLVHVRSTSGEGAEFLLLLPVSQEKNKQHASAQEDLIGRR